MSDVSPLVLKLSFEVSGCKPLMVGCSSEPYLLVKKDQKAGAYTRPLFSST